MTHDSAKTLLDAHFGAMVEKYKLNHWTIEVKLDRCDDMRNKGECSRQTPYFEAVLTIDPTNHATEKDFIETLEHELLHLVLAPFDNLHEFIVASGISEKPFAAVWHFAIEQSITNILRASSTQIISNQPA
jgi:hypothetical protein